MTSKTGTIRHPDVSEISDLTEGLLSPARTAEVRTHLTECPLCADVRASLEEIRGLLGTLPGPQRMPADIAGRIDAALAAEALLDTIAPGGADHEPSVPSHTAASDVSRETSSTSAARKTSATTRPAGHATGATGPGRRRSRRRVAVLTGIVTAAACAVGVMLFQNLGVDGAFDAKKDATAVSSADGPGEYSAARLPGDVQRLLSGDRNAQAPSGTASTFDERTAPKPELLDTGKPMAGTLPACVAAGTGRTDSPLAAERGIFQGHDAYLVVLPHKGDESRADAYVVDSACTVSDPTGRGKVLLTGTYPRT
ncbi:anti-sigma factor family protein [Streptomyces sp. NPDC101118]|uniref:anti-sigma factor family protein n=1 Tax=Streptomyces sp. NPDC101118 TaxID=3366109 RepID=UPI003825C419